MKNGLVSHWMTSPVVTVSPKTFIVDARRIMEVEKIRALPVVVNEKVVGIVTWRGVLHTDPPSSTSTKEISVNEKRVEDIMTVNPIGLFPTSIMPKAASLMMENKITALPVFNDKRGALGILTTSDLFRFIIAELPELKRAPHVSDYMTDEVVTITPDTNLLEVQRLMGTKRIRVLLILNEKKLAGLVTRTDMMKATPSHFALPQNQEKSLAVMLQPVEKIMTRQLLTVTPEQSILKVAELMLEHKIHSLPVVGAEGELIGVITESDLFRMVIQKFI
jgi:CBS-domain-containing membrane protein